VPALVLEPVPPAACEARAVVTARSARRPSSLFPALPLTRVRVGIASTVLSLREKEFPSFHPHLIPCPLGTGNDLSRVLGWGAKFPGFAALASVISTARTAPLGPELDVWDVAFGQKVRAATPPFALPACPTHSPHHRTESEDVSDAELFQRGC
jgi:hypothetical protein